jgi:hypothetical protein
MGEMRMRKLVTLLTMLMVSVTFVGCAHIGSQTNLGQVANDHGLVNVTTGDGTFENYKATGHYSGIEFGIAVGIPWIFKFMEIYPMQSNEDQLGQLASDAKADGANAMINVAPPKEFYTGFPFFIVGLYIDRTEGTGIATK